MQTILSTTTKRDALIATRMLNLFTREELRAIAQDRQIPRGRDKADIIRNLVHHAVPVTITFQISQ